jgi:hypothetical protein
MVMNKKELEAKILEENLTLLARNLRDNLKLESLAAEIRSIRAKYT